MRLIPCDTSIQRTLARYHLRHQLHLSSLTLLFRVLPLALCLFVGLSERGNACQSSRQISHAPHVAATDFTLRREFEVTLEIVARSVGASWAQPKREAAALTVIANNLYHSDLLLWAGDEKFTYHVQLGRFAPGKHTVRLQFNPSRSAAELQQAKRVEVTSLRPHFTPSPDTFSADDAATVHALALAHSPVLFARANAIDRFTDVPLLLAYEAIRGSARSLRLRYTALFSNEDGGTPTAALMARWGRATDIEWVYELLLRDGKIVEERYQGVEHETKAFTGDPIHGAHPLLAVASDNNNFSDLACSAVRFALVPAPVDFSNGTREQMMDAAVWTYRIMAEELTRERRISDAPADLNIIADPRRYLYVDVYAEQHGTSLSVELKLPDDARIYTSDLNDARLRVDRSGYFRVALRLPPGVTALDTSRLNDISLRCHSTAKPEPVRVAKKAAALKAFVLNETYQPRELLLATRIPATLRPTDTATFRFER